MGFSWDRCGLKLPQMTAQMKPFVNEHVCSIGDCWIQHSLLAGSQLALSS